MEGLAPPVLGRTEGYRLLTVTKNMVDFSTDSTHLDAGRGEYVCLLSALPY